MGAYRAHRHRRINRQSLNFDALNYAPVDEILQAIRFRVRQAAAALMSDIRGGPVTLHIGGVGAAIRFDKTFAGNGRRDGIHVDITEARLEAF